MLVLTTTTLKAARAAVVGPGSCPSHLLSDREGRQLWKRGYCALAVLYLISRPLRTKLFGAGKLVQHPKPLPSNSLDTPVTTAQLHHVSHFYAPILTPPPPFFHNARPIHRPSDHPQPQPSQPSSHPMNYTPHPSLPSGSHGNALSVYRPAAFMNTSASSINSIRPRSSPPFILTAMHRYTSHPLSPTG